MKSRYNCVTEIQGRLAFPHVSKNRFQRCCGGPLLGIRGMLWFLALSAEKSWLPPWGSLLGLEVDIILLQLWFLFWTDTPPPPLPVLPQNVCSFLEDFFFCLYFSLCWFGSWLWTWSPLWWNMILPFFNLLKLTWLSGSSSQSKVPSNKQLVIFSV